MAALGLVALKYLDQDNALRRKLAAQYQERLGHSNAVHCVPVAPDCESARHFFQIRVQSRNEVMKALNDAEIFPGVHYRDNTEYRMYASGKGSCPNAAAASNEVISLPMHMQMTASDVDRISEITLRHAR
jgi:dTDP-4-amino-4,6-dideoxygalactose transaminase